MVGAVVILIGGAENHGFLVVGDALGIEIIMLDPVDFLAALEIDEPAGGLALPDVHGHRPRGENPHFTALELDGAHCRAVGTAEARPFLLQVNLSQKLHLAVVLVVHEIDDVGRIADGETLLIHRLPQPVLRLHHVAVGVDPDDRIRPGEDDVARLQGHHLILAVSVHGGKTQGDHSNVVAVGLEYPGAAFIDQTHFACVIGHGAEAVGSILVFHVACPVEARGQHDVWVIVDGSQIAAAIVLVFLSSKVDLYHIAIAGDAPGVHGGEKIALEVVDIGGGVPGAIHHQAVLGADGQDFAGFFVYKVINDALLHLHQYVAVGIHGLHSAVEVVIEIHNIVRTVRRRFRVLLHRRDDLLDGVLYTGQGDIGFLDGLPGLQRQRRAQQQRAAGRQGQHPPQGTDREGEAAGLLHQVVAHVGEGAEELFLQFHGMIPSSSKQVLSFARVRWRLDFTVPGER